ncbi:MAG: hypothetical protein R3208_09315 [Ketobacteraceae bacterium]|nr:hypothetical protein [Ketobacteraceae bacterium]
MTEKTLYPNIINKNSQANAVRLTLQVPGNLAYFDGHFDQASILPGVVQVKWAEHFGRQFFPLPGSFQRLETLKFQQVIVPDTTIELELSNQPDPKKLYFTYFVNHKKVSSGRIVYGAGNDL